MKSTSDYKLSPGERRPGIRWKPLTGFVLIALTLFFVVPFMSAARVLGLKPVTLYIHRSSDAFGRVSVRSAASGQSWQANFDNNGNATVECQLRGCGARSLVSDEREVFVDDADVQLIDLDGKRQTASLAIVRREAVFQFLGFPHEPLQIWAQVSPLTK